MANSFGTDIVYPLIKNAKLSTADSLRTYTEHICLQIKNVVGMQLLSGERKMLVTGGGAFNSFLISRLTYLLATIGVTVFVPDEKLVAYKEAVIMALLGILRWREEANVLSSVTGATKASIGGALWLGNEA